MHCILKYQYFVTFLCFLSCKIKCSNEREEAGSSSMLEALPSKGSDPPSQLRVAVRTQLIAADEQLDGVIPLSAGRVPPAGTRQRRVELQRVKVPHICQQKNQIEYKTCVWSQMQEKNAYFFTVCVWGIQTFPCNFPPKCINLWPHLQMHRQCNKIYKEASN